MKNVACRIFKEQIDLINELPKEDRANVLYSAIMSAYNQFENQNENQTENQIEYAYISLSISKSIFNLLSKNIVFKEYNNYGGKRENSGRPKKPLEKPKGKPQGLPSENLTENENKNEYAFEGKIIKLNQKDFNNWQLAYPDLNLRAECLQRDKFLQGRPLEEQKKWFITTNAFFVKQNEKRKRQNAELNEKCETEEECWF